MSTSDVPLRREGLKAAILGIAIAAVIGATGISYLQWKRYSRAEADSATSRRIEGAVDALLFRLVDAETGQRGFLLTGDSRYLQHYNQAVEAIPGELARVNTLLAARPSESAEQARLDTLVDARLSELRQAVELQRTQGAQPAISLVLSGKGRRDMDQIRALGAAIEQHEYSAQSKDSAQREAAAATAILVTVAGSLVLLFLFAFGLEPLASPDPMAKRRSWVLRYGAAVLVVAAAALFRASLTPVMDAWSMPFTIFFPAVWFAAYFGGFRPGLLSIALSLPIGAYFFAQPLGSLLISGHDDQTAALLLVIVGFGMALLSRSQQRAVERAAEAEASERNERQWFETTLASIGDAVIATDGEGRISFINKIACSLLRASQTDVVGKYLDDVFHIVNELTRARVESPVVKVLREGGVVGLANHTVLIAQDGTEIPIDDSGAPMRADDGTVLGTVLVFRDISERRRAEEARRESELSAQLLHAQDEERRRIGRELHDSVGQNLVILKMDLDSLALSSMPVEAIRKKIEDCARQVNQAVREIRTTSYAMYPPMLEEAGLGSAISLYLDGLKERSGILTNLEISSDFGRPPRDVELAMFRVLQESLTNILRHSGSGVAHIQVGVRDGMARLEVRDEGRGIPPEALDAFSQGSTGKLGVGLRGMRERIRHLGGRLEVSSTAAGTVVRAEVPLGESSRLPIT